MTTLELNKYSETHPEIDAEIDRTFVALGEQQNIVVDSRLAWHFIPNSLKVYLKTDVEVSAKRIIGDSNSVRKSEKYASLEEATEHIKARKASENKRYSDLYGLDCDDMSNYDLIIDTSYITPEEVADIIIDIKSQ
jgi:cytidylate kinase